MARKGRRRRFDEARALKRGFDDRLFAEGDGTLADVDYDGAHPCVGRGELPSPQEYDEGLFDARLASDRAPNGSGDA